MWAHDVRGPTRSNLAHGVGPCAHTHGVGRGEPLNEAPDASASEAAEIDPSRPVDLDLEEVCLHCQGMEWDAKFMDSLTRAAAAWDAGLIG